jgi:hypothetical protein
MIAIYDTATGTLTLSESGNNPWGSDLTAMLNRHGQTTNLRGVRFGFTAYADGQQIAEHSWPPPNVYYSKTDQDVLAVYRVTWAPDQVIKIDAWLENLSGRIEESLTFTAPRPEQPYPSWTWEDGRWAPPVPYPDDGGEYVWDEDTLSWIPAD